MRARFALPHMVPNLVSRWPVASYPRFVTPLSRAALHEAGHVVLAVLLGREVERVTVRPRPETRVRAKAGLPRGKPRTDAQRARLEGELLLALSGLAAERALDMDDQASLTAALADLERGTTLALQLGGRARAEPTLLHFLATAERMLRARSDILLRVAEALETAGALEGDEIRSLVPRR